MKKKQRMEVVNSNKHPKLLRNPLKNLQKNQLRLQGKLQLSLTIILNLLLLKNQQQLFRKETNLFQFRKSQDLLVL